MRFNFFSRFLAFFLSLSLTLPNSALALREESIKEQDRDILAGLEETLLASAAGLLPRVNAVPIPAAGLEEIPPPDQLYRLLYSKDVRPSVRQVLLKVEEQGRRPSVFEEIQRILGVLRGVREEVQDMSEAERFLVTFYELDRQRLLASLTSDQVLLNETIRGLEKLRWSAFMDPDRYPDLIMERRNFYFQIAQSYWFRGFLGGERDDLIVAQRDLVRALAESKRAENSYPQIPAYIEVGRQVIQQTIENIERFGLERGDLHDPRNFSAGLEEKTRRVEGLAQELKVSRGFGFIDGRSSEYPQPPDVKKIAGFAEQVADLGPIPKIDIKIDDPLGLEIVRQLREDRPDEVIGGAIESAFQVPNVMLTAQGGHDLIISAPVGVIGDVLYQVNGLALVVAKVRNWQEVERAALAGARGIEVEPAAGPTTTVEETHALLEEITRNAERMGLLVWGSAGGVKADNAAALLSKGNYVGFSVGPKTFQDKIAWFNISRRAAQPPAAGIEEAEGEKERSISRRQWWGRVVGTLLGASAGGLMGNGLAREVVRGLDSQVKPIGEPKAVRLADDLSPAEVYVPLGWPEVLTPGARLMGGGTVSRGRFPILFDLDRPSALPDLDPYNVEIGSRELSMPMVERIKQMQGNSPLAIRFRQPEGEFKEISIEITPTAGRRETVLRMRLLSSPKAADYDDFLIAAESSSPDLEMGFRLVNESGQGRSEWSLEASRISGERTTTWYASLPSDLDWAAWERSGQLTELQVILRHPPDAKEAKLTVRSPIVARTEWYQGYQKQRRIGKLATYAGPVVGAAAGAAVGYGAARLLEGKSSPRGGSVPPAAGMEEVGRKKLAEAVRKFQVELNESVKLDVDAGFYLEGNGAVFAPILALLESRSLSKIERFAGVVETREDRDRLAAVVESDPKALRLIRERIYVVEEQKGENRLTRYETAQALAERHLVGIGTIVKVKTGKSDLLVQLNRLLSFLGYRLPTDPSVWDAAQTLLEAA
ncbi:MAG: hypothetical protein HY211_02330 [Candidatus Omnitrophica bacterium]|nr:hypothetical protein [Candidatus Omnitrophota bacterium]